MDEYLNYKYQQWLMQHGIFIPATGIYNESVMNELKKHIINETEDKQ